MIGSPFSPEKGLASARRLYGGTFQPSESLKALVYFEGGDLESLNSKTRNLLIEAARRVRQLPRVDLRSARLTL